MFCVAFYTLFYILSLFFCFLTALADCRCTRSALGTGKGLWKDLYRDHRVKVRVIFRFNKFIYIWVNPGR